MHDKKAHWEKPELRKIMLSEDEIILASGDGCPPTCPADTECYCDGADDPEPEP